MRLFNAELEILTLKALCRGGKDARIFIPQIKDDFFQSKSGKLLYKAIKKHIASALEFPEWLDIVNSPSLPDSVRISIKAVKTRPALDEIPALIKNLENWRKTRLLYQIGTLIQDADNEGGDFDVDRVLEQISGHVENAVNGGEKFTFLDLDANGKDDLALIDSILEPKEDRYIPTGFRDFDRRAGGIKRSHFMTLAGKTGEGKSALALQLGLNAARAGFNVVFLSLEMTAEENMQRTLANFSNIELGKIIQPENLKPSEKARIYKMYDKFKKRLNRVRGRFSFMQAKAEAYIKDVLNAALIKKPDLVIIDYFTLLDDADSDDTVKALGKISRAAKRFAMNNNLAVLMLAQLKEDGEVKYAKKILEDANIAWYIVRDKANPDWLFIQERKARQSVAAGFFLKKDDALMRYESPEDGEEPQGFSKSNNDLAQPQTKAAPGQVVKGKGRRPDPIDPKGV